ncbi:MAG: hypothetical protein NC396_06285 [Bacteroides sp.]|nr:hypothetical protein [Bacteroides sp.]MCM1085964.1 hypothetical protein [Bacteroides sp.]
MKQALFGSAAILIRAEEIALKAGVSCQLKTVLGPPKTPCGMKLVFAGKDEALLRKLWGGAGIEFNISDDGI